MTEFHLTTPSLDSNWRSIILFGRNVASYKFALAKALLDHADEQRTQMTLAELAPAFSQNICQHLKTSDKQATSTSSRFLDSCRSFNKDEISEDQLIQETVRNGFNNVIDAFHVVNQGEIGFRFICLFSGLSSPEWEGILFGLIQPILADNHRSPTDA